jgi:integrase
VRKQEERKDIGRALSPDEEKRLLASAGKKGRWHTASVIIRALLLTGMRSGELSGAAWGQVDFERRVLTVGRAKTSRGTGRQIPMNNDLFVLLSAHAAWFTKKFGETRPEYYMFPFGAVPNDPTRPTTTLKTAWDSIREDSGVSCRLHDLRHTAVTKLAEAGVPESTMLSLVGHMSRAMLKDWLLHGAIETDEKMAADLAGPGYHINRSNRLVLESKADMQKRGQASPDDGDALALTFAQPVVAPAEVEEEEDEEGKFGRLAHAAR